MLSSLNHICASKMQMPIIMIEYVIILGERLISS